MIVSELNTISGKWESLEKQLGLDEVASYTRPSYPDPADCLRGLISQWLQDDHLNTWSHLVHAVSSPDVGKAELGDHLKQKYIPGELFDIFTIARKSVYVTELCWSNYSLFWM